MNDKITKVYAIDGVAQSSLLFPIMGTNIRINFTGGSLDVFKQCPAKAEISAPIAQLAIEQSPLFKEGKIYIAATRGHVPPPSAAIAEYPNVSNTQAARTVLMSRYGIPIDRLKDKAAVLAEAKKAGVSFPKLEKKNG